MGHDCTSRALRLLRVHHHWSRALGLLGVHHHRSRALGLLGVHQLSNTLRMALNHRPSEDRTRNHFIVVATTLSGIEAEYGWELTQDRPGTC
jgi:hypothetical protein